MMTVAAVVVTMYVLAEVGAAVYILKNRHTVLPRMRAMLRHMLGTDTLAALQVETNTHLRKLRRSARRTAESLNQEPAQKRAG